MNIYNEITLIIVCFNSYKLIQKNLSELSKFKTIIVDNSKSDEIRSLVEGVENIKYIKTKKNLGYGKANNLGVSESKTPFILILNPDILVQSDSIEILYKAYFNYENIGILAPALYDNSNNRRSNGSLSYINRQKINKKNILNNQKAEGNTCYQFAVGCAFLIKKDFFDKIGGFDKDLFMYFEDNDLCDKTIEKDKSIIEIPESKMIHLQGLSADNTFLQKCKLSIIHKISEYIYYKKKTNFLNLYKKILVNFLDYLQRFFINIIKFKFNKSFKNLLRMLSIILYISKLYLFLY
tara:strand:- start:154 stop:1035 length:882 start_codon:yes stop_codon:yes gene_type:complete